MNYNKVLKLIFVDFFSLLVGILNGFLLPKVFSIDDYSFFKLFGLYITYAGVFHLGFSDGIYILLGGKKEKELDNKKLRGYFNSIIKIDIIVFMFFLVIYYFFFKNNVALLLFILYILPFQIVHFLQLYYRAIGEFSKYSLIQGTITTLNLLNTLLCVFIFKSPVYFILIQILILLLLSIYISYKFCKKYKVSERIRVSEIIDISKLGFIILLANTFSSLFFTIDRWFVQYTLSTVDFAYYSFATSMISIFLVIINSLTIILYPFLVRNSNSESLSLIKIYILVITSVAIGGYFVLKLIIEKYLEKYAGSLEVLAILMVCIPIISIINAVYSNLYKASKQGNKYLFISMKMLIVAVVLNFLAIYISGNLKMIAYATLVAFIIWYIYSSKDFKVLKINLKESVYILFYITFFNIVNTLSFNELVSLMIFEFGLIFVSFILYNKELYNIFSLIKIKK
jgi:O-antigen/teichoic acid export membrane protein